MNRIVANQTKGAYAYGTCLRCAVPVVFSSKRPASPHAFPFSFRKSKAKGIWSYHGKSFMVRGLMRFAVSQPRRNMG